MTDKFLYAIPVPEDAQQQARGQQQRQVSKQGVLDNDVPAVSGISTDPATRTLTGWGRGRYGDIIAQMIEELFRPTDLTVPFYARGEDTRIDGYYSLEDVTVQAEDPRYDRFQRFDGTLTREGSRRSHYRVVKTAPDTADNPFGSDSAFNIGISIRASEVQWFNNDNGSTESATVQSTVSGEHDDLEIYDATEPSFSNPWLVYDIPYEHEHPTDVVVWDDYNRSKTDTEIVSSTTVGTATVGDSVATERTVASTWPRVFATDHEYRGDPVIESDRLRLRPRLGKRRLDAYRWNASDEHWDIVQLGDSTWRLVDWDIRQIGLARAESRTLWEDSGGTQHRLDIAVRRGIEDALIVNAPNEGTVPSGLQTRLSPIASTADQDAGERGGIVKRNEVN